MYSLKYQECVRRQGNWTRPCPFHMPAYLKGRKYKYQLPKPLKCLFCTLSFLFGRECKLYESLNSLSKLLCRVTKDSLFRMLSIQFEYNNQATRVDNVALCSNSSWKTEKTMSKETHSNHKAVLWLENGE